MSLRKEFVLLATQEDANISELCRRYGISRKTAYKWMKRYRQKGEEGLKEDSRKPKSCPHQTGRKMELKIKKLRKKERSWGGRKLRKALQEQGVQKVPAPSTITAILRRHRLLEEKECKKHHPYQRFQRESPNELWQMDFKGDFPTLKQRCYPLTLLDDCTRFSLGIFACADQQRETAQQCLTQVFRRYGLPQAMLMDNGPPWGGSGDSEYTTLSVWLMRLGIRVLHGRPRHPQTQGKIERFHRTLKVELLQRESFRDLQQGQEKFDEWREKYNSRRPHEALDLDVPSRRYRVSPLPYPERLPDLEYGPGLHVRQVQQGGFITYRNVEYRIGKAFIGLPVALKPTEREGILEIHFSQHRIAHLDWHKRQVSRTGKEKENTPE